MTRDTFEQTLTTEYAANPSLKMHVMPLTEDLVVNATMKGSLCRLAVRISLLIFIHRNYGNIECYNVGLQITLVLPTRKSFHGKWRVWIVSVCSACGMSVLMTS